MNRFQMKAMQQLFISVLVLVTSAAAFTISLDQNYTGAPGTLVLPSPTRNGYDFRGWFTTDAASGGNGSAEGGDWGFRWGQQGPGSQGSGTSAANSHATNGTIHGTMVHEIGQTKIGTVIR